jgi:hypothetical protein
MEMAARGYDQPQGGFAAGGLIMKAAVMLRLVVNLMWVSFLVAVLAEGVFFSIFDPEELLHLTQRMDWSPLAGYTIGFFFFWGVCLLASAFTYFLINLPNESLAPHPGHDERGSGSLESSS